MCWPSVGGAVRTPPGVSESFTGTPVTRSGPRRRVRDLLHHLPRRELRVGEHFADVSNRAARNARGRQHRDPFGARLGAQPFDDHRLQDAVALHTLAVGGELRIIAERLEAAGACRTPATARRSQRQ